MSAESAAIPLAFRLLQRFEAYLARESLLGDREFVRTPLNRPTRPGDLLSTPLERFLLWVAAGLTIISLLATLAR